MTSRLKKRLGDIGVDVNSARANENFCLIGTPLPPLSKSKDKGEYVPLWKQDVRDEKGRRRLHGAFTGGFSAGYFNTVGSKEGWAPSTFVSSRGDRANVKSAKPEDYMDEEDLQELRDNMKIVDTTEQMDLSGASKTFVEEAEKDPVTQSLQAAMLPPPSDSVGARILKKMGWKLGQGIGPRITLRQRKLQDLQAAGVTDFSSLETLDDDPEANKHTYARRDIPVLIVPRKDNSHGLGYQPGMGLNESVGNKAGSSSAGPNISAGFGLGALNDADEDDLDVYDNGLVGPKTNRMAYDVVDEDDRDQVAIGRRTEKAAQVKNLPPAVIETFSDGTPLLPGFVLSKTPVVEEQWFPLPDPPPGWTPDPSRVWNESGEKENGNLKGPPVPVTGADRWKNAMSADQRGSMLGETPAPRSIFDYMSKKDKERIQKAAALGASGLPQPSASSETPVITIPRVELHVASAAFQGYQPYVTDPDRHARYTAFLHHHASPSDINKPPPQLPGQKIEEYNKELEDYAKAAQTFKPLSGAMASRFTTATIVEHGPKVQEGLHAPTAEELDETIAEREREAAAAKVTPQESAARMGMYGPLTRESVPWQPARLLCKRFGVKDPEPVVQEEPEAGPSSDKYPTADDIPTEQSTYSITGAVSERRGPRDLSNIGLGEDDSQGQDILTNQRPSMDVFKAIFASDDEDSDEEGEEAKEPPVEVPTPSIKPSLPPQPQVEIPPSSDVAMTVSESINISTTESVKVVDMSTFKPTFIPRSKADDGDKDREKKEKKKKKRKDRESKVLVSFADDEAEGGGEVAKAPPKKKRPKEKKIAVDDEDDAMWVEKPVPDIAKTMVVDSTAEPMDTSDAVPEVGPPRGRKRAIDFM